MELRARILEIIQAMRANIAQRKALAVLLSLLILLFSSGLIFFTLRGPAYTPADPEPLPVQTTDADENTDLPAEADSDHEQVDVLPQVERTDEEETLRPRDPFAAPPKLMGVLLGGEGEDLAIIEAGGNTYISSVGDSVAGLWKLRKIQRDKAILLLGEEETVLYLGR